MIEISISGELAAAHPEFMSGCAQRGHHVRVFGDAVDARGVGPSCGEEDQPSDDRSARAGLAARR